MGRDNCKNHYLGRCEHSGSLVVVVVVVGWSGMEREKTENFFFKVILQIKISKHVKKSEAKNDTKQN